MPRNIVPCLLAISLLFEVAQAKGDTQQGEIPRPIEEARGGNSAVVLAFITGAATAAVSLGVGGSLAVSAESDAAKGNGIYVVQAGLALSPLVAHGVLGEWDRGALFSIAPAAGVAGMVTLLHFEPHTVAGGPAEYQYSFSGLMLLSTFSAAFGVFDVLSFHDRKAGAAFAVSPDFGRDHSGVRMGGQF